MPIQEQNIVFLKSQVMDDVPEGGGAATGIAIPDGVMNNVFEDISDLDRAYGRFNLRKVFLGVRTLSTDLYGGAKSVLTALPTDPALGYTLFSTNAPFDTRAEAINQVEAYLYKGPTWNGVLHENHITGMRAISVLQRVGTQLPVIGKTLCLVQNEGLSNQTEQYVRIIKVEAVETTFADGTTEYVRWVVTMTLSDALRHNFNGHAASRTDSYSYTDKARIRDTQVADATRYFGSQPLVLAGNIGDLRVRAASMFAQLVPSAQTETPLISQILNAETAQTWSAGTRSVVVSQQAHTLSLEVTVENRRYNWIETLAPRPAAASLTVAYRSQGAWYTLTDNGAGVLSGFDAALGTGSINYTTGAVAITLGTLPDADSALLFTYASPAHYTVRSGASAINETAVVVPFTLDHTPAVPESVVLAWTAGGAAKTATVSALGVISGHGSGTVDPITGEGELRLTQLPDRGTPLTINYTWLEAPTPGDVTVVTENLQAVSPIPLAAIPEDQSLRAIIPYDRFYNRIKAVNNGTLFQAPPQQITARSGLFVITETQTIGSISGPLITLNPTITVDRREWNGSEWTLSSQELSPCGTAWLPAKFTYRPAAGGGSTVAATQSLNLDALTFRLLPMSTDRAVANSLRITLGGISYDDANGTLLIPAQSNLVAGSVNYDTGECTLTWWTNGANVAPSVTSLLARYGNWTAIETGFRTGAAPIKPQSLSLVAVTEDGVQITGSADPDGAIAGEWMRGAVNYETGVAQLEFGQMAGTPAVWTPRSVDPSTLRYNAVAYSYIPLDAAILGIDAVRLPSDGRVPIYRAGDVVMILHAATTAGVPAQVSGTGPYLLSCGRTRLAFVRVTDVNGAVVASGYTLDRDAGILSWTSIAGLATPVTVKHTVGDLRLVTDVQITGELTLARPLTHTFPANESLVAACLIHGDRRARVSAVWDQSSWNGTWSDGIVGTAATATLNTIDYPITVTNEGCDTDRWLLRWLTTTTVELISEKRGLVWTGSYPAYVSGTPADIAPINPRTRDENGLNGTAYLTIPQRANGGGWAAGNVVRINTVGAIADFWIARAILQSDEPSGTGADGCELYALGNIDRP